MTCPKVFFRQIGACGALLECTQGTELKQIDPALSLGASNYTLLILGNVSIHVFSEEQGHKEPASSLTAHAPVLD